MTRQAPDLSLLRFLRAHADDSAVLNAADSDPDGASAVGPEDLSAELLRAARMLAPGNGIAVSYARLAASPEFLAYRRLARRLRHFDPATLVGREARTAFWINVFNALVIDAVISLGVRESVREAPGFFHRAAYEVGAHRFALDDIEHGLLRANRPSHPRLPPPFPAGDPRAALGPGVLDPRIHFALNCGTRSCPPVAFYDARRLDAQLDAAVVAFINAEGARLVEGRVLLSPLFAFYLEDFGGWEGVAGWLGRYLTDPHLRGLIAGDVVRSGIYDWSLNRADEEGR